MQTVVMSGGTYTSTAYTEKPGGSSYIFVYNADLPLHQQSPGIGKIVIQNSVIPKDNLNVMYLNLFGTDRGNLW